jgi:histidinol-phosphate aminotransferase
MRVALPIRRSILAQKSYEPPREGRLHKVRLDFNENTAGCSPAVRRALAKLTTKQLAMYPEYELATKTLATSFGVRSDELMLANGGDDALRVFFDAFVDAGSAVLICEPTFPMYRFFANIADARIEAARYDKEMSFPIDAVVAKLKKKPRVLFIANPNNPTGTLVGYNELERILKAATHTAVVIDEAYADFSGVTVIPWIRKYPQLFVTRTFSKAAGLAGLRLGAVIANGQSIELLRRAMPPFPVNITALTGAVNAVRDRKTLERYVLNVRRGRSWLEAELKRLGIQTYPSAGNFLLANFGEQGPRLFKLLEAKGILLRERSSEFQAGFVRISIGTQREMTTLLREIKKRWRLGPRTTL